MEPAVVLPSIDPSRAPKAVTHDLKVPVRPNPIMPLPAPKRVPTTAGGVAPKTKPCYGMQRPIIGGWLPLSKDDPR